MNSLKRHHLYSFSKIVKPYLIPTLDHNLFINPNNKIVKLDNCPENWSEYHLQKYFDLYMKAINRIVLGKNSVGNFTGKAYLFFNNSDEATKFNLDVNLVLAGYPELPRHSDKSTSYGIRINGVLYGGEKASDTYVTINDIAQGDTHMYDKLTDRLMPVLKAELSRINTLSKYKDDIMYDHSYVKDGQSIQIFDDILSEKVIKKLKQK